MSSFVERLIDLQFTLNEGVFFDTKTSSVTLKGLRVRAMMDSLGGVTLGSAQIQVWGMTQSMMNQLCVTGTVPTGNVGNKLIVLAGDAKNGMTQAFEGNIYQATINYAAAPNVVFEMSVGAGVYQMITPAAPNSYKGSADVATIIGSLAKAAGFAFKNNGVTSQLSNPYFYGSAVTQIKAAVQAAGIVLDIHNGMVNIWPRNGLRDEVTVNISPQTGLVGYPSVSGQIVNLVTLFDPNIVRGRRVLLTSDVPQANGEWYINSLSHELGAKDPNGPWFTTLQLIGKKQFVKNG